MKSSRASNLLSLLIKCYIRPSFRCSAFLSPISINEIDFTSTNFSIHKILSFLNRHHKENNVDRYLGHHENFRQMEIIEKDFRRFQRSYESVELWQIYR